MNISKLKIVLKYLTSGMGGVVDYLLDLLNNALAGLDPAKKDRIVAVLNLSKRVLATLRSLQWLCPTKWQIAYGETVGAVETTADVLTDLVLTPDELKKVADAFQKAVQEWKSGDDETCEE